MGGGRSGARELRGKGEEKEGRHDGGSNVARLRRDKRRTATSATPSSAVARASNARWSSSSPMPPQRRAGLSLARGLSPAQGGRPAWVAGVGAAVPGTPARAVVRVHLECSTPAPRATRSTDGGPPRARAARSAGSGPLTRSCYVICHRRLPTMAAGEVELLQLLNPTVEYINKWVCSRFSSLRSIRVQCQKLTVHDIYEAYI
jgi:hypothetical protein